MKRTICIVLFLSVLIGAASAGLSAYTIGIDWQMSAQAGLVTSIGENFSLQGALGASVMGLIAGETYASWHTPLFAAPWRMSILLGVPNFLIVPTLEGAMLSLGGAFEIERRFSDRLSFAVRLGAGYPFFFEQDRPAIRDITFPLNLWPEAALVMFYHRPAP